MQKGAPINIYTHHAYCFVGSRIALLPKTVDFIKENFNLESNSSDFLVLEYENLTIEDSRNIKAHVANRPSGLRRAIIIATHAFTREAQNALLKTFEDPGEGIHFFLIIPSKHILLPTLCSRLSFLDTEGRESDTTPEKEFLKLSYKDRLSWIKDFTDSVKDGKAQKQQAIDLLGDIQRYASVDFPISKSGTDSTRNTSIHKEILNSISYIHDTSSSVKMILEHLALILPEGN